MNLVRLKVTLACQIKICFTNYEVIDLHTTSRDIFRCQNICIWIDYVWLLLSFWLESYSGGWGGGQNPTPSSPLVLWSPRKP